MNNITPISTPAIQTAATAPAGAEGQHEAGAVQTAPQLPGVFATIGALPPGTLITEPGLAKMLGKCTASIKAAVDRGELPRPARLMGKNTWSAASIIRHHEARMEAEGRKFRQLRA